MAYEVQLVRDPRGFVPEATIESTGRVSSAESTAVAWPFPLLAARTCAWWRVRTYQDPASDQPTSWSRPQRIATGPSDDWSDAVAIWAAPAPSAPADSTLRATVTINELRAGVFIRVSEGLTNGYMWQITAPTTTAGSLLRPHVLVNGSYTLLGEVSLPRLCAVGQSFELTIECLGTTITTSIDGAVVDTRTDPRFTTGYFGVRTGNMSRSGSTRSSSPTAPAYSSMPAITRRRQTCPSTEPSTRAAAGWTGHHRSARTEWAGLLGAAAHGIRPAERTIAQAMLHATAQSPDGARQFVYRSWCNGQQVGVGPIRSADSPRYQTHDLTPMLRAGAANALAFQCWTTTGKSLQALLDVDYTDGHPDHRGLRRFVAGQAGRDLAAVGRRSVHPLLLGAGRALRRALRTRRLAGTGLHRRRLRGPSPSARP